MKRRIPLMFAAALMVVTMLVAASPAQAQNELPCPEGSSTVIFLIDGGEGVACLLEGGVFPADGFCPEGFVEVPGVEFPTVFQCEPASPDGGGAGDGSGGGGGGDGAGGGGQQGGGGVEITQEGEQEADAGEIDQTFDVS